MARTITEIQDEIIEEFSLFGDWMDKYEYIIELGKSLPMIDEQYKNEDHLIKGCQSRVWLHAALEDGQVSFTADSDAVIVHSHCALNTQPLLSVRCSAEGICREK